MDTGYEDRNQDACWFSFLSPKSAQVWNWHSSVSVRWLLEQDTDTRAHKVIQNRFLLNITAETVINKQLLEKEQSTTKQISCKHNDIGEFNHIGEVQSGITVLHTNSKKTKHNNKLWNAICHRRFQKHFLSFSLQLAAGSLSPDSSF